MSMEFALDQQQIFNREFMRRVWAKRRALKPAVAERLEESASAKKRRIELALALQDERQPHEAPASPGRERVSSIIRRVAAAHSVPVAAIIGSRRFPWLVAIRHAAMVEVAMCRPDLSLWQIGRAFGKDHTSILHALRKAGIQYRPLEWREREWNAA